MNHLFVVFCVSEACGISSKYIAPCVTECEAVELLNHKRNYFSRSSNFVSMEVDSEFYFTARLHYEKLGDVIYSFYIRDVLSGNFLFD